MARLLSRRSCRKDDILPSLEVGRRVPTCLFKTTLTPYEPRSKFLVHRHCNRRGSNPIVKDLGTSHGFCGWAGVLKKEGRKEGRRQTSERGPVMIWCLDSRWLNSYFRRNGRRSQTWKNPALAEVPRDREVHRRRDVVGEGSAVTEVMHDSGGNGQGR